MCKRCLLASLRRNKNDGRICMNRLTRVLGSFVFACSLSAIPVAALATG